nr:retrotransposon protein [Tanacetum cinerariifolium]
IRKNLVMKSVRLPVVKMESTPWLEDEEYTMAVRDFKKFFKKKSEICLGVILEHDEWIKDSGYSKHMTGNQKLFSTYKAYNGVVGHVVGSDVTKDQLVVLFQMEVAESVGKIEVYRSSAMLRTMQLDDAENVTRLLSLAREIQRKVDEKNAFIRRISKLEGGDSKGTSWVGTFAMGVPVNCAAVRRVGNSRISVGKSRVPGISYFFTNSEQSHFVRTLAFGVKKVNIVVAEWSTMNALKLYLYVYVLAASDRKLELLGHIVPIP